MSSSTQVISKLENFCKLLNSKKVRDSKDAFLKLPKDVQKLLLECSKHVLKLSKRTPEKINYKSAFLLFRLFRNPKMKNLPIYKPYSTTEMETLYKQALKKYKTENKDEEAEIASDAEEPDEDVDEDVEEASVKSPKSSAGSPKSSVKSQKTSVKSPKAPSKASKAPAKKEKKVFGKKYQKKDEPENDIDPLYIYYTSLYRENPESKIAIVWLTEHGVFEGAERKVLEKRYANLTGK